MIPAPRSEALTALSRLLAAEVSVAEALGQLSDTAVRALPGAAFASVSLERNGRPTTAVATGTEARRIDESQYASGDGPCLDAWRLAQAVSVDDVEELDDRYPAFRGAAVEEGVRSSLSIPLPGGEGAVGSLNLYRREPGRFSRDAEGVAAELAVAAAVAIAYDASQELSRHLTRAMESRAVIEQAKGVLMAASPAMTAEDAFELLRSASQRENVKLREIARRIVSSRGGGRSPG